MEKKKIKVMTVFGTRPEAIKMAPIVLELQKHPDTIEPVVAVTAQHREMLDQVLNLFQIKPDHDLNIMAAGQTLFDITTRAMMGLDKVLTEEKPDIVLVHGDTTTTFAGALAAYYHQTAVGHVEAGLRTHNKYSPFPEEMNQMCIRDRRNAELTGLTGHFYQKDGRSAEVKADHGSYDNETKDIKIDGNVQITTSDGAELTSDELLWTAEQGMLSAIGQAKVSNDTIRAWGERIDSTDGFNKIKISGKAHIEKLMEGAEQK